MNMNEGVLKMVDMNMNGGVFQDGDYEYEWSCVLGWCI